MPANNNSRKKYVLIDDDPTYQSIILKYAKFNDMDMDAFNSLMELGSIGMLGRYDAAIVDYDLGQMNGVEIAEYLSALFGDIPMVLVSERPRMPEGKPWPPSIKKFLKKSNDYNEVLDQVRACATDKKVA